LATTLQLGGLAVRQKTQIGFEVIEQAKREAALDLVVPFTTPELTRAALNAAGHMGSELHAAIRLIKIQVVPYALELEQSPVYLDFLKSQLAQFDSALPATGEVRLARDADEGLRGALRADSVVILASPRRLWRTRNESLAAMLRRAGHKVVVVYPEPVNAVEKEVQHA
jgi:hypothetical protein